MTFRMDEAVASAYKAIVGRHDANETAAFTRQLEYIYTELYNVEYPLSKARQLIPVDGRVPSGADSFTYRTFDQYGQADLIHNYANDFPEVEVAGKETKQLIKGIGAAYSYSIQDMRAAMMTGYPLVLFYALRSANVTVSGSLTHSRLWGTRIRAWSVSLTRLASSLRP